MFDQAPEEDRPRVAALINRIDAVFQISCLVIFVIVGSVAWNVG